MSRRLANRPAMTGTIGRIGDDGLGVVSGLVGQAEVRVHGVLEGETVVFRRRRRGKGFHEAELVEVIDASPHRVAPRCTHFGVCGGCSMQHISSSHQLVLKENWYRALIDDKPEVSPKRWLPALEAEPYRYRRRARLGVKAVPAKGRVLVGFRERFMPYVADIDGCEILAGDVGALLVPLAELIATLSIAARLPQIEVAVADNMTALVLRVLDPPSRADLERLAEFESRHDVNFFLQSGGPETVSPLSAGIDSPRYRLRSEDQVLNFEPADFVQVNTVLNEKMVALAMELLAPTPGERVLDLFCGLGNFSLPLATRACEVVAVDGDETLVNRARENARLNGVNNLAFHCADLFAADATGPWRDGTYDAILLDPPRSGAERIVSQINELAPSRVLYISCNPKTLVRDATILCGQGYQFAATGIMDMFPQTRHAEAIALFEKSSTDANDGD